LTIAKKKKKNFFFIYHFHYTIEKKFFLQLLNMSTAVRFPRELLKWLQSLNITSSIKNVKFDFGNGYVVAEILNRYYPQDVRLNSFDTGQSKNCRKENWQLLKRMFNVNISIKYK